MLFNLLADNKQPAWLTYVLLGVIIAAVIGLLVWQSYSNKKRQKEANDMISKLQKGDKIKTIGGVCGYLVEVNEEENTIVIETGNDQNKSYVKFDRNAIYQTGSMSTEKAEPAKEQAPVEEKPVEQVEEKKEEKPAKAKKAKKAKKEAVVEAANEPEAEEVKEEVQE